MGKFARNNRRGEIGDNAQSGGASPPTQSSTRRRVGQMSNLLYGKPTRDIEQEWARLHKVLTDRLVVSTNLPDDFGWPLQPARA